MTPPVWPSYPSQAVTTSQSSITSDVTGSASGGSTTEPETIMHLANSLLRNTTRKRKANQKSVVNSPEQAEIDFLKLEVNAVRTQVVELETSKADLEKKNKIMSDVIKMHEERQAARAYRDLLPDQPPMSTYSSQQTLGRPNLSTCCCSWSPPPTCSRTKLQCCCSGKSASTTGEKSESEIRSIRDTISKLAATVEKLEGEIVDIINKLEKCLPESNSPPSQPRIKQPLFKNPTDIPNYDIIVAVDSEHPSEHDESVASMDEFVPGPGVSQELQLN